MIIRYTDNIGLAVAGSAQPVPPALVCVDTVNTSVTICSGVLLLRTSVDKFLFNKDFRYS